tara:strand:- start:100 stop:1536 length:1437 start_codon:yes stop_codon:yes gene_type:complete
MIFNFLFLDKKKLFLLISLLLGGLFSLSFDPYNIPFFSLIIVGLFFKLNDSIFSIFGKDYKLMFYTGILFGFSFFITSIYWITNSIFVFDSNLAYLTPFPLIILPLILGIFYGLMQLINIFFWSLNISRIFFFSALWILFEMIRSMLLIGFPWNLVAYSWSWSISFMQSLSLFGVFGLGLISIFCSAGIFSLNLKKANIFLCMFSISILITIYLFGYNRVSNYENVYLNTDKIRLVSTNFHQEDKWSDESFEKMISLGSNEITTFFPETAFGLRKISKDNWFGGFIRNNGKQFFNSAQFNNQIYDKRKLVPFGEFIPFHKMLDNIGLKNLMPFESFSSGKINNNFNNFVVPLICYEGIFSRLARENMQPTSGLLVNITNDAWFGDGAGPIQHFTHVRFRSVEYGLPLVRSANMGISALVNPIGQVEKIIPHGEMNFVDVKIPSKISSTFYTQFGDNIAYFFIVIFFLIGYSTSKLIKD